MSPNMTLGDALEILGRWPQKPAGITSNPLGAWHFLSYFSGELVQADFRYAAFCQSH